LWQALQGAEGPIVAATDYMKVVADQVAPWLPGRMETLGTDGFGRSDNREYLRRIDSTAALFDGRIKPRGELGVGKDRPVAGAALHCPERSRSRDRRKRSLRLA
jgi:hypothetical protein